MATCATIVNEIRDEVSNQFSAAEVEGTCYLVTPFLLPDNTPITLAVETEADDAIVLSDFGQAADYAFLHGISDSTVSQRLKFVERRFGIDLDHGVMSKRVPVGQAAQATVEIITGVQDVGYLVYRRSMKAKRETFRADLESYLTLSQLTFRKNVVLPGATGDRSFDYVVRGDHKQLALSLFDSFATRGAESRAKVLAFDVSDVRQHKDAGASALDFAVVLDTRQSQPPPSVLRILETHFSNVVRWEERHQIGDLLAS